MDPPPLPPLPTSTTPPPAATNIPSATSLHLNYPDSVDSSPRSRTADTYDHHEPLPPLPGGSKLRVMCSYGGHIMPRPHDKVLCYVGGETRLVVVDRHASLSVLCSRLSRTLLHGRPFLLKYQLPNEDLDNLVTVTTDEDLENLIEEYDRIAAGSANSAGSVRIRLFLFFNKPETAASMGALLTDAKSETWFVDALNGSMLLPRGFSDSAMDQCLVNLDSDVEAQVDGGGGEIKPVKNDAVSAAAGQEMQHFVPDSENASSFGSTSSMQSMANLPPIRVRVEESGSGKMQDNRFGIEEQLAQISFVGGGGGNMYNKQGDGFAAAAALPPRAVVTTMAAAAPPVAAINPAGGSNENLNRILSDDERSDQGAPTGFRKPPLPLQPVQHKPSGAYNLPSPDSVASDASASSFSRQAYHQEQVHVVSSPINNVDASMSSQIQTHQVQDSGYELPQQSDQRHQHQQQQLMQQQAQQSDQHHQHQQQQQLMQQQAQQQFVHPSMHYIPHPGNAPVQMQSYYQVYAAPSQQQHPLPVDHQQYPVYVLPVGAQPQQYMTMQSNIADMNPSMVPSGMAHKDANAIPPMYPTKAVPVTQHEMAAGAYRTAPQMVQVPSNQFQVQQQYPGFPHPSQSIAVAPANNANYGYEYTNATHDQIYYAQAAQQHQAAAPAPTPLPPQYQTMSQAAVSAAIADANGQYLAAVNQAKGNNFDEVNQ